MAINFPDSPNINDFFTVGNRTWQWNGESWQGVSTDTRTVSDLLDTTISAPVENQILKYDGIASKWINSGDLHLNSLEVLGDLIVGGTTTTVNANDLVISDPMIYIGEGNTSNVLDLGFVAAHGNGSYAHTGLVRDATDDKWKLFDSVTDEPTTTVNFAQATNADLVVGNLEPDSVTLPSGDLQASLDSKVNKTQVQTVKTGAYTLTAADRTNIILCDGTFTITVPSGVFNAGDRVDFINTGTGVITFAGSGLTLNSVGQQLTLALQYASATLFFVSSNSAVLIGRLA